jgi:transposase
LDHHGKIVKQKTIKGHWSNMLNFLESLAQPMEVCFEASCGYGVVHDRLQRLAQRVVVAHPGRVRLIFSCKRKNDRIDAQKLAKLLYLDEVPTVHVPALEVRSWRELIETRRRQIDARVRVKNQIRAQLRGWGVMPPRETGGLWTRKGLSWLKELGWPTASAALRCQVLTAQLEQCNLIVATLTAELDRMAATRPGVHLLMSIPGVGPRTAEAFMAYVDTPDRFERINQVPAYFGLVPAEDSSGGKERWGHITKEGPATARKLLVEAAWRCIDTSPSMRASFDRIVAGQKERRRIALIAIARRLTRIMLAMLKSGEAWSEDRSRGVMAEAA